MHKNVPRKLPPYSKPLAQLQLQGLRPKYDIYLFIGNHAWKKGENSKVMRPTRTLVLPPWECPTAYTWPVKQCGVFLIDTGYAEDDYVTDLVFELLKADAEYVCALFRDKPMAMFRK